MTFPVTAPVRFPVTFPVTSPVTAPVTLPVRFPVTSPVKLPVTSPVRFPVTSPVTSPVNNPFSISTFPSICNVLVGLIVPIPTLTVPSPKIIELLRFDLELAPIVVALLILGEL